ncbi:MAG: DUF1844 domain-containing protein [Candidatus Margulisiibacteriota bacterium]
MEDIRQPEKKIDSSWKENTGKEKEGAERQEQFTPPEPDFSFFVTTLAIQASIFLGIMENPATGKKAQDLTQAKFIIDTLAMIGEKTKGNLNEEEAALLEKMLFELRTGYVHIAEKDAPKP